MHQVCSPASRQCRVYRPSSTNGVRRTFLGFLLVIVVTSASGTPLYAQWVCWDTVAQAPCPNSNFWLENQNVLHGDSKHTSTGFAAGASSSMNPWHRATLDTFYREPNRVWVHYTNQQLAQNAHGKLYIVGSQPGGDSTFRFFRTRDHAGVWSDKKLIPSLNTVLPRDRVVVTPDEQAHFFFLQQGDTVPAYIVHGQYVDLTDQWLLDTIAAPKRSWERGDFNIATDGNGSLHVTWSDLEWNADLGEVLDQVYYATNASGTWATQHVAPLGESVELAPEPGGRLAVTYLARINNHNYNIMARNTEPGGTNWIYDTLDTEPAPQHISALASGPDGRLHAILEGTDFYNSDWPRRIYYLTRDFDAPQWDAPELIFNSGLYSLLEIDCESNAHVTFQWYFPGDLFFEPWYGSNRRGTWEFEPVLPGFQPFNIPPVRIDQYGRGATILSGDVDPYPSMNLYLYRSPQVFMDAVYLNEVIGLIFYNAELPCGLSRYDQNCDGVLNNADLDWLIEYIFFNGPWGCR